MILANRLQIGVELTGRCDLRCRHCLRDEHLADADMDPDLFSSLVAQATSLGRPHLALTGGEPSLHPRLDDLLAIVRRQGLTCHLVTNGHSYPAIRQLLEKYRGTLTSLSISLDGGSAQAHEAIRGPGSFRRTCMAIAMAVFDGWEVTTQCVVHPHNRGELAEVVRLCDEMGVDQLLFAYMLPLLRARQNGLVLDPEEWEAIDVEIRGLAASAHLPVGISSGMRDPIPVAHCHTLKHLNYSIDHRGRLTFCCQLSGVGNDEDVIADLRTVPLGEALDRQLAMASQVTRDRLQYYLRSGDDPRRHHHCDFCLRRFGKVVELHGDESNASGQGCR